MKIIMRRLCIMLLAAVCVISGAIAIRDLQIQKESEEKYEIVRESIWGYDQIEAGVATKQNKVMTSDALTEESYMPPSGLKELMENPSVIGWLKIDDTRIDYPIVQNQDDNNYYLHHDFLENDSSAGSIYMDSNHRIGESGLHVIYGHNMKNGEMFKDITKFISKDYMEAHSSINIYMDNKMAVLKPLYCYTGPADGTYRGIYKSPGELRDFLYEKTGQEINSTNVFVFITCSYETQDGRLYLITEEKQ